MAVEDIIASLHAATESADTPEENERAKLLAACTKLQQKLETPKDIVMKLLFSVPDEMSYAVLLLFDIIAMRLAIDMKIFDTPSKEVTLDELVERSGAERLLVKRIMRLLTSLNLFTPSPTSSTTYLPSPHTALYSPASPFSSALTFFTAQLPSLASLPTYFATRGYASPTSFHDGPWRFAFPGTPNPYDYFAQHPTYQKAGNVVFAFWCQGQGDEWFEFFPVEEKLQAVADGDTNTHAAAAKPGEEDEQILIVDIGGGMGHVLTAFAARFPTLRGKLIVQDLPGVIADIPANSLPASVTAMAHDFFTPQPVIGARAYYLRAILHAFPDEEAREILRNVKGAMDGGSLVLVNEVVVAEDARLEGRGRGHGRKSCILRGWM
ncbi:S-adenosyl-L-methionine-dependent methyltransferase [Aulographum hederae CBS 113979]|uniref:S-adenosyl-L-methionine-dependent methyltransferase n=1 Tax=Aulographum hederae CBS 113979 TaxID=1176131 RepID=A0A6G1H018_9PEZI|nr:S-adenosyl-L-methionine-dependent methyltransferase [Aulographum hederae CBS 113979]